MAISPTIRPRIARRSGSVQGGGKARNARGAARLTAATPTAKRFRSTAVCFTAARRIGIGDQLRELADTAQWLTQAGSLLDNAGLFPAIRSGNNRSQKPLSTSVAPRRPSGRVLTGSFRSRPRGTGYAALPLAGAGSLADDRHAWPREYGGRSYRSLIGSLTEA